MHCVTEVILEPPPPASITASASSLFLSAILSSSYSFSLFCNVTIIVRPYPAALYISRFLRAYPRKWKNLPQQTCAARKYSAMEGNARFGYNPSLVHIRLICRIKYNFSSFERSIFRFLRKYLSIRSTHAAISGNSFLID